jgi:hypothetical protein
MRMAGALFNAMDKTRDIFVGVMMIDAAEMRCLMTARADDAVAMHHAPDSLAEDEATFRTAHTDFHVIDGVVHDDVLLSPVMLRDVD